MSERGRGERGRGRGGARWRGRGWRGGGRGGLNSSLSSVGSSSSLVEPLVELTPCPFPAWRSYLPQLPYSATSSVLELLDPIAAFLRTSAHWVDREKLFQQRFFLLDLAELFGESGEAVALRAAWPGLEEELEEQAEKVCGIVGLARHNMITGGGEEGQGAATFPIVRCRPVGKEDLTPLRSLKSSSFQRLVTVSGTVVRLSAVRPTCLWLAWSCPSCRGEVLVHQPEGRYVPATRCRAGCRNTRNFTALRSSLSTICVDRQTVRLQELADGGEAGRVPRTLECELTEDLCDTVVPGDVVRVTGVVKVVSGEDKGRKAGKNKSLYLLYLSALSLASPRAADSRTSGLGVQFTYRDYALIQEVHGYGPEVLRLLVASLCPSIWGHELVKAGLLLGLFGGSVKRPGASGLAVRGDPHILVVGDPGLGKSQMLTAAHAVAPRGVFVTGNTCTAGGLTVTLTRESGSDFALDAGALVLADQGCCCIDEFDKMGGQHAALLEAMEQQCVSVAKAGVVCSLPARTAILAAANPTGGHYNRAKTVAENLKMGPALLSRFDLVFILMDKRDPGQDELLSEHVMALHSLPREEGSLYSGRGSRNSSFSVLGDTQGVGQLAERLVVRKGEEAMEPLPHSLLRKYIAYARRWVHPALGQEAKKVLQDFYLQLRAKPQGETTPVTTRQLESLIRLTEARARLELREEASQQDAIEVVEIMRASMVDTFTDNIGALDFGRGSQGSGMSSRGAAKKFVTAVQRQAARLERNKFTVDELREVANIAGVKVPSFMDFMESLNNQGYFLKKSNREYQLLSVDY